MTVKCIYKNFQAEHLSHEGPIGASCVECKEPCERRKGVTKDTPGDAFAMTLSYRRAGEENNLRLAEYRKNPDLYYRALPTLERPRGKHDMS